MVLCVVGPSWFHCWLPPLASHSGKTWRRMRMIRWPGWRPIRTSTGTLWTPLLPGGRCRTPCLSHAAVLATSARVPRSRRRRTSLQHPSTSRRLPMVPWPGSRPIHTRSGTPCPPSRAWRRQAPRLVCNEVLTGSARFPLSRHRRTWSRHPRTSLRLRTETSRSRALGRLPLQGGVPVT